MRATVLRVFPIVSLGLLLGGCPGQLPPILGPFDSPDGVFGGTHLRNYHGNLDIGGIYVTAQGPLGPGSDILPICDRDSQIIDRTLRTDGLSDSTGTWTASFGGSVTALKIAVVKFGIDTSSVASASYAFTGVEQVNVVASRTRSRSGSIKDLIGANCKRYIAQYRDVEHRDVFVIAGAVRAQKSEISYTRKAETSAEGGVEGTGLPGGKAKVGGEVTGKRTGSNLYVEIFADKF